MRLGVLFSGGKDSCLSLLYAKKFADIVCLITMISENKESYMFHTLNVWITKLQAKALEIPIIVWNTKGEKEKEIFDLKKAIEKAIEKYSIDGIVSGSIASLYQASRIQRLCNSLQIECFNPLWLRSASDVLREAIKKKFEVLISGTFAYELGKFVGNVVNTSLFFELKNVCDKYKINIAGEGGEIETTVLDMPLFNKRIEVKKYEVVEDSGSKTMNIKKAILVDKHV